MTDALTHSDLLPSAGPVAARIMERGGHVPGAPLAPGGLIRPVCDTIPQRTPHDRRGVGAEALAELSAAQPSAPSRVDRRPPAQPQHRWTDASLHIICAGDTALTTEYMTPTDEAREAVVIEWLRDSADWSDAAPDAADRVVRAFRHCRPAMWRQFCALGDGALPRGAMAEMLCSLATSARASVHARSYSVPSSPRSPRGASSDCARTFSLPSSPRHPRRGSSAFSQRSLSPASEAPRHSDATPASGPRSIDGITASLARAALGTEPAVAPHQPPTARPGRIRGSSTRTPEAAPSQPLAPRRSARGPRPHKSGSIHAPDFSSSAPAPPARARTGARHGAGRGAP